MNTPGDMRLMRSTLPWITDALDYWMDRTQRTILFWDVLRTRGNEYLAHYREGQPPVLVFKFKIVMDGRTFEQPVNYALVRIQNRRSPKRSKKGPGFKERRVTHHGKIISRDGNPARPIVVIDPRAGHGPGIGGSKLNSQIGVAVDYGHPVYFILFFTNPEPGQTIPHVHDAQIRFLEEVARLHPDAPKPAVIGNCQAGWATALIGADRPEVTGPMVLNGSPLSYWGGVEGANPMRYKGGLVGGVWLTSLWSDLGNGRFDGAHLVAGFEDLNPANTHWTKLYHLFANVDTEAERFLNFEKWWGGFFKMNAEEIHFIVDSLFIGNELEQGRLTLSDGRVIDLKNIKDPIIAFSSSGDNITPPPQALNWIQKVYGTVNEIKRCDQVIIYMVHDQIGHLGIFVSGKVARKEHRQILGNVGWLEFLEPGLYEMIIEGEPTKAGMDDYQVRFEARRMSDLEKLDDGQEDELAFKPANLVSRNNDQLYNRFVSPWVKLAVTPPLARFIRLMHPLRVQRYMFSDRNPGCYPIQQAAELVKGNRHRISEKNQFAALEDLFSESMKAGLDFYRDTRDRYQEFLFKSLYDSPWIHAWANSGADGTDDMKSSGEKKSKKAAKPIPKGADAGGFADACIRIMILVAGADKIMDTREFAAAEKIIQADPRLGRIAAEDYKDMVREQSRIIHAGKKNALAGLAAMLPARADRRAAYAVGEKIAAADGTLDAREAVVLGRIRDALGIKN